MLLSQHLKPSHYLEVQETELLLHSYKKGDEITLCEPGFWQVALGVVQLSKISAGGDEIILGWATAHNYFGDLVPKETNYRA